jgi:hypothetical protein
MQDFGGEICERRATWRIHKLMCVTLQGVVTEQNERALTGLIWLRTGTSGILL